MPDFIMSWSQSTGGYYEKTDNKSASLPHLYSWFHVSDANWLPAKSFIPGLRLHSEIQAEFGADDHRCIVVVGFHSGQMLVDALKHKRQNTDLLEEQVTSNDSCCRWCWGLNKRSVGPGQ